MSVGASIIVVGVRVGVCLSGCVSRARGVVGSVIDCTARNGKEQQERRPVGSAPIESPYVNTEGILMPRVNEAASYSEEPLLIFFLKSLAGATVAANAGRRG